MTSASASSDAVFYKPADQFFADSSSIGLTYDDVSLATLYSEVLPRDAKLETTLGNALNLKIPIVSADMDTVTESRMAISMALNGGLGLIHYNMSEREQLSEVSRVKNHVHGLIQEPIKVSPNQAIGDVLALIDEKRFSFSTFPVVDEQDRLLGLLPGHVLKQRYASKRVGEAMTPRAALHTLREDELGADPIARADQFFTEHLGIHKLLVVDREDRLRGLFTLSDVERITQEHSAQLKPARDAAFRLICGAAISATRASTGELDSERIVGHVGALVERGVDVIAVSTAHGHSKGVGDTVRLIRATFPDLPIIAGNVTSGAGGRISRRVRSQCDQSRPRARLDLHHPRRRRRRHPPAHGPLRRLPRGTAQGCLHPRRRWHHQIGRHRQSPHSRRCRDLRWPPRRLPGSPRTNHGDQRQTL